MKRILITGGAGFIGCNFVRYMLDAHKDYSLVVLDKFSFSRPENLKDVMDQIEFVQGDITKKEDVKKVVSGCDAILNFAAQTHVDRSIEEAGSFVLTEVLGTQLLVEAAKNENVERFVQISTDEVYGSIDSGFFKDTDPLNPRNPYAAAKAGADLVAKSYFVTFGTPIMITRSSNNYGPFQHPEKFIPTIITRAAQNQQIPLYGDGMNVRDWIFVLDNCRGIDTVLHKGKPGEIYHIAADNERRNIEIVKTILQLMSKPESLINFVKDRPGHDRRYALDTEKLRALGWKPEMKLEDGIKLTVEWYLKNESWWKTLLKN